MDVIKSAWTWIIIQLLGIMVFFATLLYGFIQFQQESAKDMQLIKQHSAHIYTKLNGFLKFIDNGIKQTEKNLILYHKDQTQKSYDKLYDKIGTIIALHPWAQQIIIVNKDGKLITSSDDTEKIIEKFSYFDRLIKEDSEDLKVSAPVKSTFGISKNKNIILFSKKVIDNTEKVAGYVIVSVYPETLFAKDIHESLDRLCSFIILNKKGQTLSSAGCFELESVFFENRKFYKDLITLQTDIVSQDFFESRFFDEYKIKFTLSFLFSILMFLLGMEIRREKIMLDKQKMSELEDLAQKRAKELNIANKLIEQSRHSLLRAQKIAHLGNWDWDIKNHTFKWSDEMYRIFGYEPGKTEPSYEKFLETIHPDDRHRIMEGIQECLANTSKEYKSEHRIILPDGSIKYILEHGEVIVENKEPVFMSGTVFDITEIQMTRDKLKKQALTDELTHIFNRKAFNEQLQGHIDLYSRYEEKESFVLMMFDIDDFKQINDIYGHIAGDKVLVEISKAIGQTLRRTDKFFRVGGEEFIILFPLIDFGDAKIIAEKIRQNVSKLKILDDGKTVTISIGLTKIKENDTFDTLYSRVDELLYLSKTSGKNRVSADR